MVGAQRITDSGAGDELICYTIDLLVEEKIVVEFKVVEKITPVHNAQVLSYLKFSGCQIGLLLNFNTKLMKDGIRRFIMNH